MKKRTPKGAIAVILVIIAVLALILSVRFITSGKSNSLIHKTFSCEIVSYIDSEDGIMVVCDDDATTSRKTIFISEDTMFTDDSIKEKIFNKEIGIKILVESEFWTQDSNDYYPATLVSPKANTIN